MSDQTASDPGENAVPTPVSKLPLVIIGAVVALAVLVVVALVAFRGPVEYAPGTPEAALQSFLQAGFDNQDQSVLFAMLTPDARARCERDAETGRYSSIWDSDGLRAELETMRIDGDKAVATVGFRHGNSTDPFNDYSYSFTDTYTLLRVDGKWLIDRAGWPYQFTSCTTRNRS
jgi:hypothetical protein